MKKRQLMAGDMIITNFWGVDEVCKVYSTSSNHGVVLIRLEAICHYATVKKDYYLAEIPNDILEKFPYKYLHESKWYLVSPLNKTEWKNHS